MTQRWLWASVVVVGFSVTLSAQTPKPTFEVTSVKRRIGPGPSAYVPPLAQGTGFRRVNTSVSSLILFAFDLRDFQLVGGPDWMGTDRFDVEAKASSEASTNQMRLMVQSLLEDRFKLVTHEEQREMPIYTLLVARPDGRLGPNLKKRNDDDCNGTPEPPSDVPAGAAVLVGCGTMATLVRSASTWMGAPVVDKTGLTGRFEYSMYTSEQPRRINGVTLPVNPDRLVSDGLPSYATALREQLGLALRATRGAVDVLVIDSVQQPTEN